MARKPKKFKPYEKTLVRHIYGIHEGRESLLYADEIALTISSRRDERQFHVTAFHAGQDLLDQKIKLKMWDKDEIAKKTRSE